MRAAGDGFIVVLRNQFREGLGEFAAESRTNRCASSARRSYYLTTFIVKDGSSFFLRICRVDAIIEQVGTHIRYLPPYSTDFNPIELAFAKLKAFLRAPSI